jgi:hypothetical protein
MALWERDPKANQRMALLLVVVEALAILVNFYTIFSVYLYQIHLRLQMGLSGTALLVAVIMAVVLCAALMAYEGRMYLRGRAWARYAFLAENGLLITLGMLWFLWNRMGSGLHDVLPLYLGLALPLVTLFPLMWPFLVFRVLPTAPGQPSGA